jgi:hypothetical protein
MDGRRSFLLTTAFVVLATFGAHGQESAADSQAFAPRGVPKPWKSLRGVGRVLDLTKLPVVIDEPGLYALDRNWNLTGYQLGGELIRITADDVTLDLHGYKIELFLNDVSSALITVSGNAVSVRNGGLEACCEGAVAVSSTGSDTRLERLDVYSHDSMRFAGPRAAIVDSDIYSRWGIAVENSVVERNKIGCRSGCLVLRGDGNQVLDNRFEYSDASAVLDVQSNGNLIARNGFHAYDGGAEEVVSVSGDRNVVRDNTAVITETPGSPMFVISGTGNTLDGNIVASGNDYARASVGIAFTADGNFYGDNRMAATVPFALGGTVQTDWGGNVGY